MKKEHKKKTWTLEEESALAVSMYHFIHPESPKYNEKFTLELLAKLGLKELMMAQAEAKAFFAEMEQSSRLNAEQADKLAGKFNLRPE